MNRSLKNNPFAKLAISTEAGLSLQPPPEKAQVSVLATAKGAGPSQTPLQDQPKSGTFAGLGLRQGYLQEQATSLGAGTRVLMTRELA